MWSGGVRIWHTSNHLGTGCVLLLVLLHRHSRCICAVSGVRAADTASNAALGLSQPLT